MGKSVGHCIYRGHTVRLVLISIIHGPEGQPLHVGYCISCETYQLSLPVCCLFTEEQRQQAAASFSSEGSSGSQPYPSHRQRTSSPQRSGGGPPLQAYPAADQPLPLPVGFPSTKEDVNYLEEINRLVSECRYNFYATALFCVTSNTL